MFDLEFILPLFVLSLLMGSLGFYHYLRWERLRRRLPVRPRPVKRVGHTIDVTPIRPRLEAIKQDFAAAAHHHAQSGKARAGLLAQTRHRMAALGFFRDQSPDHAPEHHTR